ncbi:hypothetical protein Micbo1qcDRAFT_203461 [Microdochium bolleyi]|uniref:Uncharacterized protein n=1 Tax=Microdochium bolleyi TaxID=196109 RepID=A0A136J877_9PEZI|nr:hypothetical protein Micbo1qcDRAFT_203461 [Microdochium bolleyi]
MSLGSKRNNTFVDSEGEEYNPDSLFVPLPRPNIRQDCLSARKKRRGRRLAKARDLTTSASGSVTPEPEVKSEIKTESSPVTCIVAATPPNSNGTSTSTHTEAFSFGRHSSVILAHCEDAFDGGDSFSASPLSPSPSQSSLGTSGNNSMNNAAALKLPSPSASTTHAAPATGLAQLQDAIDLKAAQIESHLIAVSKLRAEREELCRAKAGIEGMHSQAAQLLQSISHIDGL